MGGSNSVGRLNLSIGYVVVNVYDTNNCGVRSRRKLGNDDTVYDDDDTLASYDQDVGASTGWLVGVCNMHGSMNAFLIDHDLIKVFKLDFDKSECRDNDNNLIPRNSTVIATYPTACSLLSPDYFGANDTYMYGAYVIGSFH